jgi:hypothetical protein
VADDEEGLALAVQLGEKVIAAKPGLGTLLLELARHPLGHGADALGVTCRRLDLDQLAEEVGRGLELDRHPTTLVMGREELSVSVAVRTEGNRVIFTNDQGSWHVWLRLTRNPRTGAVVGGPGTSVVCGRPTAR